MSKFDRIACIAGLVAPALSTALAASCSRDFGCVGRHCSQVTKPETDGGLSAVPLGGTCSEDAECDDHQGCNGSERCHALRCAAGEAVSCSKPATCSEREGSAACVYPEAGPWLLFANDARNPILLHDNAEVTGQEDLVAVLEDEAGRMTALPVSRDAVRAGDFGVSDAAWSSDRRFVVFSVTDSFPWFVEYPHMRAYWSIFDATGPHPPKEIRDLPQGGELTFRDFSSDGRYLFIQGGNTLYLSEFVDDSSSTKLFYTLKERESSVIASFSDDGRHALLQIDATDKPRRFELRSLADPSAKPVPVPAPKQLGVFSDDGRWLAYSDGKGLWVARDQNRTDASPLTVPEGFSPAEELNFQWSADGSTVGYTLQSDAGTVMALSMRVGDSSRTRVAWLSPVGDWNDSAWAPETRTLLIPSALGPTRLVELGSDGSAKVYELPYVGQGSIFWLDDDTLFQEDMQPDGGTSFWLIARTAPLTRRLVAREHGNGEAVNSLFFADYHKFAYVRSANATSNIVIADLTTDPVQTRQVWATPRPGSWTLITAIAHETALLALQNIETNVLGAPLWSVGIDGKRETARLAQGRSQYLLPELP